MSFYSYLARDPYIPLYHNHSRMPQLLLESIYLAGSGRKRGADSERCCQAISAVTSCTWAACMGISASHIHGKEALLPESGAGWELRGAQFSQLQASPGHQVPVTVFFSAQWHGFAELRYLLQLARKQTCLLPCFSISDPTHRKWTWP